MDKPNRKTNNLLDGLEFLKENGVDLDIFFSIDLLSPVDEIVIHGLKSEVLPYIGLLRFVGFINCCTVGVMVLNVHKVGRIKIIIE